MTKERLKAYRDLKAEQQQLEELLAAGESRELRQCYRAKLAEVEAEQLAIEEAIENLEPRERALMRYRYIDGYKWEKICVLLHYEWRQTHNIHSEALRKLQEAALAG